MAYLYETHMHTLPGSACAFSTGAEQARQYKALGYTGIIVTDHFFRGNSGVDRKLPWEERIHLFCKGYEDAKAEGDRIGLQVFFGWEENYRGDEYLVYGLTKEWLLAHPECERWTRREQLEAVHAQGGCVVQAHPFRQRNYISRILLADKLVDGIEVANAGNIGLDDACAYRYAQRLGLPVSAGSDCHGQAQHPPEEMMGVYVDEPLKDISDYVRLIRENRPHALRVPEGRFDPHQPGDDRQPSFFLGENEEPQPTNIDFLADE